MKVLLASSEVHPYSKSGGLADMVGALAKSISRAGQRVGVVTPLYRGIRERFPELRQLNYYLEVPVGADRFQAEIWTLDTPDGVTFYFVHQPQFFDRTGLYQEGGHDYVDNAQRFIFFSKCVVHLTRYLPWQPELLHVHDWQTSLAPILLLHQKLSEGWIHPPRTCLTIHNLAYQGHFPRWAYDFTNLPSDYFNPSGVEFYGGFNCLKAGIVYSDLITTVSPRYAREIATPQFGCGLDGILRQRQNVLAGILNGVDYDEWNTENNPHLKHPYSVDDLSGKSAEKSDLQKTVGLPVRPDVPLFGSITRLAQQKGVDIQLGALEEMLAANMQFVLLGSGSPNYEQAYQRLQQRDPDKVAIRLGFDQALSHRIEAGADFFLMPSLFEPCGLNQMYSLRYGTIPVVRTTGGLDDSIIDPAESVDEADGIKFSEYSVRALAKAIRKALVLYESPSALDHFRRNGMRMDFSWARTTARYLKIYTSGRTESVNRDQVPIKDN